MDNEGETCTFCVNCEGKIKVIPVQGSTAQVLLDNLKSKISTKFSMQDQYSLQLKVEQFGCYVDIDEQDDEDLQLLREGRDIRVIKQQPAVCSPPPTAPSAPDNLPYPSSSSNDSNPNSKHSFDVRKLVQAHPHGTTIEMEYEKNKILTTETRLLLTSIVCAEMVKQFSYYPTRDQKIMVAKQIIAVYSNLASGNVRCPYDIWFDPSDSSMGHINTKFNTLRRSLPKTELLRPRKSKVNPELRQQEKKCCPGQKRTFSQLEELPEDEEKELSLYCKRSTPENKKGIVDAMAKTFNNRRNWIQSSESPSATEILKRYPRFQDIPILVDIEFRSMFGEQASSKLLSTWETRFVPGIIHVAKMSKLPKISFLLEELFHPSLALRSDTEFSDDDYEPSSDEMSFYAFHVLIHLLPSQSARKSSIAASLDYFLVMKPVGTHVEAYLEDQKKRSKERTQPYLLCLGTRAAPSEFFVIVDGRQALPCADDFTLAVDKLFKIHYVFNLQYATQLSSFFAFLETNVYNVGARSAKVPVRVKELMLSISALSK